MSKYSQQERRKALVVLSLLALIPYLPLVGAPLLIDERVLFFEARKFVALDPLAPLQLPLGGSGTWRPFTTYVYWLDSGAPAPLSHALNLALHLLVVLFCWRWLRGLVTPGAALMGASFFAVHAAHVASAGWVAGRADLLMTACVLLALLAAQRRSFLICALAAGFAVLAKETGIVILPMLLLVAQRRSFGSTQGWVLPLVVGVVALPLFMLSLYRAEVAVSYWPSLPGLAAGLLALPAFGVELVVPLFRPIGVGYGWQDTVGIIAALPVLVFFIRAGVNSPCRDRWFLGLGLAGLALLPVLHVLPNDGGQWYLLLPSLGIGLSWGVVLSHAGMRPQLAVAILLVFALYTTRESHRWAQASVRVEQIVWQARQQSAGDPVPINPPIQDPRDWPHMGPSLCCGIPYQVLEDLPPR